MANNEPKQLRGGKWELLLAVLFFFALFPVVWLRHNRFCGSHQEFN